MYSVVLMMALTGGAEAADFGGRGCGGCSGCHGCVGSSCHGCNGCHGCRGGLFSGLFNRCHGCNGCHGCSGSVCHGCTGSSCHGCNGCHGCRGGLLRGLFHRDRCHGCNGCHGGCHGTVVCTGCAGGCSGTVVEPKAMPKEPKTKPASAPATIVVTLPAEAKLTFDGNVTNSTSERRTFVTPALDTDSSYVYSVRAEVVREGRPVVETRQVTVRGGQTVQVPFEFSTSGVASR